MGTIIVGMIVCGIVAAVIYQLYRDRKKGQGCGCSGGCRGCMGCTVIGAGEKREKDVKNI